MALDFFMFIRKQSGCKELPDANVSLLLSLSMGKAGAKPQMAVSESKLERYHQKMNYASGGLPNADYSK